MGISPLLAIFGLSTTSRAAPAGSRQIQRPHVCVDARRAIDAIVMQADMIINPSSAKFHLGFCGGFLRLSH
jgi:hypothetical protein